MSTLCRENTPTLLRITQQTIRGGWAYFPGTTVTPHALCSVVIKLAYT